jgi:hypothetical protein
MPVTRCVSPCSYGLMVELVEAGLYCAELNGLRWVGGSFESAKIDRRARSTYNIYMQVNYCYVLLCLMRSKFNMVQVPAGLKGVLHHGWPIITL